MCLSGAKKSQKTESNTLLLQMHPQVVWCKLCSRQGMRQKSCPSGVCISLSSRTNLKLSVNKSCISRLNPDQVPTASNFQVPVQDFFLYALYLGKAKFGGHTHSIIHYLRGTLPSPPTPILHLVAGKSEAKHGPRQ